MDHLISCCNKITQTACKQRHDNVATMIHGNICKKYKLLAVKNWWDHKIENVSENEDVKTLWDFQLQTNAYHTVHQTQLQSKRKKNTSKSLIQQSQGIAEWKRKSWGKVAKCKDLQIEIERLWWKKTKVISMVTGTLSAIPKHLEEHLNSIGPQKLPSINCKKQRYWEQLTFCDGIYRIKTRHPRSLGRTQCQDKTNQSITLTCCVKKKIKNNNNNDDDDDDEKREAIYYMEN